LLDEAVRAILREELPTALRDELRFIIREELAAVLTQRRQSTQQQEAPVAPDYERYVDAAAAGAIAGVRPATVRSWVERGQLRGYHSGRLLRIRLDELKAYLGRSTIEGPDVVNLDDRVRTMLAKQKGKQRPLPSNKR
jgi:excisionase family DNA binding protein